MVKRCRLRSLTSSNGDTHSSFQFFVFPSLNLSPHTPPLLYLPHPPPLLSPPPGSGRGELSVEVAVRVTYDVAARSHSAATRMSRVD